MSHPLTLQDQVTEYVSRGWSVLPLQPGGKEPLVEALPLVNGYPSWKPYQTSPAPVEDVLSWFADYGPDMGGTGLNIGLVTGCAGLYVLDFDTPELPPAFRTTSTTTVKTGRGWHLYFTGPPGLPSANLTSDGVPYEFKGVGSYVVAPVSTHSTGVAYSFVRQIPVIKSLADAPCDVVPVAQPNSSSQPLPLRDGGRACLDQIWSRNLTEGERDKALYVLYQGLVGKPARNSEEAVAKLVRRKNDTLREPLPQRELEKILRRGPESSVVGHQFDIGCSAIRRLLDGLGWLNCDGCRYKNDCTRRLLDAAELGKAASKLSSSACKVLFALLDAENTTGVRYLSVNAAVRTTGLVKNTVSRAMQELRTKGFLTAGDQILTPPEQS
ncbi:MAG: bifunctional DNA primase/polymerase [Candidatus Cryosericum sp.]